MSDCCTTIISAFLKDPSLETAASLIAFYRTTDDPETVANLARALADSGSRLDFPGHLTADIASTGGPSSLSTLLCPLFLAHSGFSVPKLGVQGRPAGGIDVMARLPGFNIAPSAERIYSIIKECRFAHFLADQTYAPADQTLFRFRQQLGAQAVRNLVVGSILAKKLAVGVQLAGLEVRAFAGGNFGTDAETASTNASFFKRVAADLGIAATAFVTDCTVPYQPYIGRGEALQALYELFYGEPSEWLLRHAAECLDFAAHIAANIGKAFESPEIRKRIYWGLSALTSLCVGDVGEVIRLYEDVLKQAKPGEYPVQPELQHKCFQHICTSALHDINRRNPKFKNHALGFANAAHKLLRQSLAATGGLQKRVRQYAQVYVSISTGDQEWIYTEIRDLLDAGIYVLDAATVAPRTKRVNADPIQQFILTYRKLYGVSTLIGLAYRDRFELSGKDLESWLREPEKAEDVFIRNQGLAEEAGEVSGEDEYGGPEARSVSLEGVVAEKVHQIELWDQPVKPEGKRDEINDNAGRDALGISVRELSVDEIGDCGLLVAGLGFEERCEGSLARLLEKARFRRGVLVGFSEEGRTNAIKNLFDRHRVESETIQADCVSAWKLENSAEDVLVDVSGLAKPAIFHFCRHVVENRKLLYVCHTQATEYFPSDADIEPVIKAHNEEDIASLLDSVATLFKGEERPYRCLPLLADQADESRQRALITFSSAKHERLLALLDERFYDFVGIGYSSAKNGRGRISELAARFAVRNINGAVCYGISTVDLAANLAFLSNLFFDLYHKSGDNVEIGLTGSKISGVAAAILAARWKVSQAWYVKPERFNPDRFTTGVGISRVYRIAIDDSPAPNTATQRAQLLAG